jgi:hypothetical protein
MKINKENIIQRKGDPYEYSYINGKPMYRKKGSDGSWESPKNQTAEKAIVGVLGNLPKTSSSIKIDSDNRSDVNSKYAVKEKIQPIQWATPEQYEQIQLQELSKRNAGTLTEIPKNYIGNANRKDKILETIGWQDKAGKPAITQGLTKTIGAAGAVTAMGAVPILGAAYSLYNLPGAARQAYNTYSKSNTVGQDVTLGEQIRDYGNLGLLLGGAYGGVRGTMNMKNPITTLRENNIMGNQQIYKTNSYNQEIPGSTVVTSSKTSGSIANQNMNRATQEFLHGGNRTQNVQIQGNNVKPQGTARIATGANSQQANTTYINQRPGHVNSSYLPVQNVPKTNVSAAAPAIVAPNQPFYLTGFPTETPNNNSQIYPRLFPTPDTKKEQRIESITYKRGNPEFEAAWKASKGDTFMYKGKLIKKTVGGTRNVGPDQDLNLSTLQIIPDSTSIVRTGLKPGIRLLNGGIKGNPNVITVNKSNLKKGGSLNIK